MMENYKQLLLFILMFIIIYLVEHITYYNSLINEMTTSVHGLPTSQKNKSDNFKKSRKTKK